jgi:hypothetical protein
LFGSVVCLGGVGGVATSVARQSGELRSKAEVKDAKAISMCIGLSVTEGDKI